MTTVQITRSGIPGPGSDVLLPIADAAAASASKAKNTVPFATYASLAATTGMAAGDRATVQSTDGGTHTDPVVGGTVNNSGLYQYSASPAGWQRLSDLDSVAAANSAATATTAANAALNAGQSYPGSSARFPPRNRTNGSGSPFAMIAQPTTNMGTWFNADGTFLMSFTIPRERYRASQRGQYNYARTLFGTNMDNTGTTAANQFSVAVTGDNFGGAAPLQTRLYFGARSTGVTLLNPAGFLLPESYGPHLLLAVRRTGNTLTLDVWDCDTGTKYAGTTYDATGFVGWLATNAGSYFQVGAGGVTNTAPTVPAFNPTTKFGWDGDIGMVGYYAASLSDTACQNISLGMDLPTATTAGTWRWIRELDGTVATLAKPSWASGDTTSAAQVVVQGLDIDRGSSIVSRGTYFTLDRKIGGDAHVDAVIPGQVMKSVVVSGKVRSTLPANDDIEVRFLTTEGTPVTPWQKVASILTTDATWTGYADVPRGPVPYVRQARLSSQRTDPTKWIMDATRFGVGYRFLIVGQSQIANLGSTTRGLIYNGRTRFSYIERAADAATDISAINCLVTNPRMMAIGDGVVGIMNALDYGGLDAVCAIELQAVGGTSALDWINDSVGSRTWTPMLRSNEVMDGGRSCVIWNWDPADIATNYGVLLDAVFCGTGVSASDHFIFGPPSDGGTQVGATVVYMPTQRTNGIATTESDFDTSGTYGTRRDEGVAWVLSKPFGVLGLPPLDLELQDGLHPSTSLASGTERHGQQLGVSAIRGLLNDRSTNPTVSASSFAFTDGTHVAFTFDVTMPNFGRLTNGLGATSQAGADKAVRLIEISTDGTTWSKSGFTAAITGRARVTVSKTAGSWPASAAATGSFTFTGVGTEGDTITVAGNVFTLSATGNANNEVQIGATTTATAQSFRDKVNNLSSTLGVTASGTGTTITITANSASPSGNTITISEVSSSITVSGATLTGGTGLMARVGYGGFGSYGVPTSGITSGNTAARDYWMYDGYVRHINGKGIPVLPTNTLYTVTG